MENDKICFKESEISGLAYDAFNSGFREAIESLRAFAEVKKEAGRTVVNHILAQAIKFLEGKLKEKEKE